MEMKYQTLYVGPSLNPVNIVSIETKEGVFLVSGHEE